MSDPRISFVIPAFNAADTITESIDSIFNGNFATGDEVIIVNDCSTDETAAVIERLKNKYNESISIVTNEQNKGCPATRNVGIRKATNELIFNLDADNVLVSGSIQKLKAELLEQEADLVAFADYYYFVDSTDRITHYWHCNTGWLTTADLFAGHINPGPGGNFLYTKASWERIGGYWEYGKGLHEAWGFTLKQLMNGSKIFVVPDTFYFHRHGHESLFVSESKNKPGEIDLLLRMMTPFKDKFMTSDWEYIQSHPQWHSELGSRPLQLSGAQVGSDGRIKITWYGRYRSVTRKIQTLLKQATN